MSPPTDTKEQEIIDEIENVEETDSHPTLDKLQKLQAAHDEVEEEFKKEMDVLQKKYRGLYAPFYTQRHEALTAGPKLADFWLTALQNHPHIAELIEEHDEPILKYLEDIRVEYEDETETGAPAFSLRFVFAENPFFTPNELVKRYTMQPTTILDDSVLASIESTEIEWKEGKDVTKKTVSRKQRNPRTKQMRTTTSTVDQESFFQFFQAHEMPSEAEMEQMTEEKVEEVEEKVENDFDIAVALRDRIIFNAVEWYTGEAELSDAEYESEEDEDEDEEDSEEESDEDDEETDDGEHEHNGDCCHGSEDEEEEVVLEKPKNEEGKKSGAQNEDCKQQ